MDRIAVLGAGVMGTGVAYELARTGHDVVLIDVCEDALARSRAELRRQGRLHRLLGAGPSGAAESRVELTTSDSGCRDVDWVIENVPESWEIKRAAFERIDAITPPHCLLASNTSAIPIDRLAAVTRRPAQVIGTHFMNPVPLSTAVEVVRGSATSDETLARTRALLGLLGKEPIVVSDGPGFVTNRVLMGMINEAALLLEEKRAAAPEIDRIFKACLGHPMGPLETADLIGLDTVVDTLRVLDESAGDRRFAPSPLLARLAESGLTGRKAGQGFYRYGPGGEAAGG